MSVTRLLVPIALMLACSGCAGNESTVAPVTSEEYDGGFEAYRSCLSDAGYQLRMEANDGPVIRFSVPAAAVESGVDVSCYEEHFATTDERWQLQNADSSKSASTLAACLEQEGITPASSMKDMVEQATAAGIDIGTCAR